MCEKCRAAWAASANASSQKAQRQQQAATQAQKKPAAKKPAAQQNTAAGGTAQSSGDAAPSGDKTPSTSTSASTSAGAQETTTTPASGAAADSAGGTATTSASSSSSAAASGGDSTPAESKSAESTGKSGTEDSGPQASSEPAEKPQKKEEDETPTKRQRAIDVDAAVRTLNDNAEDGSQGKCAKYVRLAIEAGGPPVPNRPLYAKDYGSRLSQMGFEEISPSGYVPEKGDVVVMEPPSGEVAGHIQMWNGSRWVSDFRQRSDDIYPGPRYRKEKVRYAIYRP